MDDKKIKFTKKHPTKLVNQGNPTYLDKSINHGLL